MQTLLEVVKGGQFKQNVIVGPSKAGKTTTLLWLYLKLKEMPNVNVKALSYQDITCNSDLDSLVRLVEPEDIILFDLNSFEKRDTQNIWNFITACMDKVLVIALSGQAYITSGQGCKRLLDRLEQMKEHAIPLLSEQEAKKLCRLHYENINNDDVNRDRFRVRSVARHCYNN